jgi:hypothetical protein
MIEFRSRLVTNDGWANPDDIEKACNEWAAEGWEVFSVVCVIGAMYRLTARRTTNDAKRTGRRFR